MSQTSLFYTTSSEEKKKTVASCNLQVFILKVQTSKYELNLALQFTKKFVKSNIETAVDY